LSAICQFAGSSATTHARLLRKIAASAILTPRGRECGGSDAGVSPQQVRPIWIVEGGNAVLPPTPFADPLLSYAIEPKSRGDEDKISTALQRIREEDPTIQFTRDPQTKELQLSGQGQLHIEVTVAKMKRRFGVDVN
jgi:translation elongation factor EF-G